MKSNNNTPTIRFAGFADPWERRKLGEVTAEFKSGDYICAKFITENGLFPVYGGNGIRGYTDIYNYDGEYALVGRQGALCGNVKKSNGRAYFTEHAIAVQANNENSTDFLYHLLSISNLGQYSDQSAQPGLAVGKLVNICANFPAIIEQQRIASLYNKLDFLIEHYQRKYEKLVNLKKATLDKMFPKNGELVPAVRFAGFSGNWERRRMGDIAEIVGGGTPSTMRPEFWNGNIDWYAPAEMEGVRYAKQSTRRITELGLHNSSARILPAEKTVLFTSRAGIGKMAILKRPGATNQGFQSMILKNGNSAYFIYSLRDIITAKAERIASGSTFLEISARMLANIEILVPGEQEQRAIGHLFEKIDDLIESFNRKIGLLQKLKSAFLEKMFV